MIIEYHEPVSQNRLEYKLISVHPPPGLDSLLNGTMKCSRKTKRNKEKWLVLVTNSRCGTQIDQSKNRSMIISNLILPDEDEENDGENLLPSRPLPLSSSIDRFMFLVLSPRGKMQLIHHLLLLWSFLPRSYLYGSSGVHIGALDGTYGSTAPVLRYGSYCTVHTVD